MANIQYYGSGGNIGTAGNDTFRISSGGQVIPELHNGWIDGGDGKDTLVILESKRGWNINKSGKTHFLTTEKQGLFSSELVTIELNNMEKVQFIDGTFKLAARKNQGGNKNKNNATGNGFFSSWKAHKNFNREVSAVKDFILNWQSYGRIGKVRYIGVPDNVPQGHRLWTIDSLTREKNANFLINPNGKIVSYMDRSTANGSFWFTKIKNFRQFKNSYIKRYPEAQKRFCNSIPYPSGDCTTTNNQLFADWVDSLRGTTGDNASTVVKDPSGNFFYA